MSWRIPFYFIFQKRAPNFSPSSKPFNHKKIKFKNIVIPKLEKNSAIIKKGLHKKFEKIIGLIETAHGLNELKDIGQILNLERVGIGEVDFAADLGITEEEKYLSDSVDLVDLENRQKLIMYNQAPYQINGRHWLDSRVYQ